ncbi:hypothetical protein [Flavobacterium sp.]|jgi:hypothetical protein|uniref:hypothetical protein n=1 Tax=Flavobacterium sp. TaxID=239 RepID=UPI0037BE7E5F
MNKILILVALTLFLKPIFPVVDYVVNYDYIRTVLCENKAKPELKCNGKCQLMKSLAKESEEEKPINSDKKSNIKQEVEVLFFQIIKSLIVKKIYFQKTTTISDNYSNLYSHLSSCLVFHPPTFIS